MKNKFGVLWTLSHAKQRKEACDTGVASMAIVKSVIKTFSDSIILQTVFVSINQILRPSNLSVLYIYSSRRAYVMHL